MPLHATPNLFRLVAQPIMAEQNGRDFQSLFGSSPEVCALTWNLLDLAGVGAGTSPKHLLWALMLLKTYAKESFLCSKVGVSRATYRHWAWLFIRRIAALSRNVVRGFFAVNGVLVFAAAFELFAAACVVFVIVLSRY